MSYSTSYEEDLNLEYRREKATEAAAEFFIDSVVKGEDLPMRMDSDSSVAWMPSDMLGECSNDAKAKLFAAAGLAFKFVSPDKASEHNVAVAEALRAFVKQVAGEYAEENYGAYI